MGECWPARVGTGVRCTLRVEVAALLEMTCSVSAASWAASGTSIVDSVQLIMVPS